MKLKELKVGEEYAVHSNHWHGSPLVRMRFLGIESVEEEYLVSTWSSHLSKKMVNRARLELLVTEKAGEIRHESALWIVRTWAEQEKVNEAERQHEINRQDARNQSYEAVDRLAAAMNLVMPVHLSRSEGSVRHFSGNWYGDGISVDVRDARAGARFDINTERINELAGALEALNQQDMLTRQKA